jgi:hypothetical protein
MENLAYILIVTSPSSKCSLMWGFRKKYSHLHNQIIIINQQGWQKTDSEERPFVARFHPTSTNMG